MDLDEYKRWLNQESYKYSQYAKEDIEEGNNEAAAIAMAYSNAYAYALMKLKEVELNE